MAVYPWRLTSRSVWLLDRSATRGWMSVSAYLIGDVVGILMTTVCVVAFRSKHSSLVPLSRAVADTASGAAETEATAVRMLLPCDIAMSVGAA